MDEALRGELLAMVDADDMAMQEFLACAGRYREAFLASQPTTTTPWPYAVLEWSPVDTAPSAVRRVVGVVHRNIARLREIVAQRGWPGRAEVGMDGADAAWLVLQHASSGVRALGTSTNLEFCRCCVPLLEEAVVAGNAHPRHLAATVDSLCRVAGQPPAFAALAMDYHVVDGRAAFRRSVDLVAIDQRRARIGLPPLAGDVARRSRGEALHPAGPERAEPWPEPSRRCSRAEDRTRDDTDLPG